MCGARVVAGRSAGPLFHKKVTVEGADEDLSFNILIPLPAPPPPPQQQPPQGIVNKYVCIMILFSIVAPPTITDSVTTQQQQGILHARNPFYYNNSLIL